MANIEEQLESKRTFFQNISNNFFCFHIIHHHHLRNKQSTKWHTALEKLSKYTSIQFLKALSILCVFFAKKASIFETGSQRNSNSQTFKSMPLYFGKMRRSTTIVLQLKDNICGLVLNCRILNYHNINTWKFVMKHVLLWKIQSQFFHQRRKMCSNMQVSKLSKYIRIILYSYTYQYLWLHILKGRMIDDLLKSSSPTSQGTINLLKLTMLLKVGDNDFRSSFFVILCL